LIRRSQAGDNEAFGELITNDRKLQNAMKSSERCLFLPIPFVEVLEGLVGAATTKRLTAHGVRKFCRRSHITKNKGEPNGTCADQ
jgi:hypothetical protein